MDVDKEKLDQLISVVAATVSSSGPQPAGFLVQLMAGYDPRDKDSRLYRLVQDIDLDDRLPTPDEWIEIRDLVLGTEFYRPTPVTLDRSHKAATDLMEFIHPKLSRTAVENAGPNEQTVESLTPVEVETFEDWFFGEF